MVAKFCAFYAPKPPSKRQELTIKQDGECATGAHTKHDSYGLSLHITRDILFRWPQTLCNPTAACVKGIPSYSAQRLR